MAQTWMLTAPRSKVKKRELEVMIEKNDCKKWVIGREKGKEGYEHWQIRVESSNDGFFEWCKAYIPSAHIEKAEHGVDECIYEHKEGKHVSYADRPQTLQQRYGELKQVQKRVLKALGGTNDREVLVWYDQEGKVGKSWLCGALWERGQAYYTPPTVDTVKGMIQWVASCYASSGYRPYVIIDIPRSWKWSAQLYTAIESIKDGLVYDTRYTARLTNIRGVKVLVLTNTLPKFDKLSNDRWRIVDRGGAPFIVTLSGLPPFRGVGRTLGLRTMLCDRGNADIPKSEKERKGEEVYLRFMESLKVNPRVAIVNSITNSIIMSTTYRHSSTHS